ncbi:GNAT family N-acetyltransferase [Oerskovia flava]|uniref:GNAT family N-acetyltransferase n=1 Tax=Oerskovia flava TaxID=2986422 RepID=UPI0022409D2B|nr:GNAT family N-acetyltransferase [Oerskovia sp. JB1-3-2]
MKIPGVEDLRHVADTLGGWQVDDGALHLHPGDLGWYSMRGAAATAAALRTWSRDGKLCALGLLDGPGLLRMAVDPDLRDDDELAQQVVADVRTPERGVLDAGSAAVEARGARRVAQVLAQHGWQPDEPWTPLHKNLAAPVGDVGLRVEPIDPDRAEVWVAVHWSAFRGTPFTEEDRHRFVGRWRTMASGPFSALGRSVAGFDADDNAVAVATVWSAGPGRPGLVEPMGVHRDHRGHGHGTAITRAATATLRDMGASSAIVCAESSNAGAVATYVAAGFTAHEPVADLRRIT